MVFDIVPFAVHLILLLLLLGKACSNDVAIMIASEQRMTMKTMWTMVRQCHAKVVSADVDTSCLLAVCVEGFL